MKINQSGRSMIEMLGVLAIIGVLSVGGIAGYSKAMAKFRVNKSIDQISHIVANTRILYGSQANYADLGTNTWNTVYTAKLFPEEMLIGNGASHGLGDYKNPFNGNVSIAPAGLYTGDNKAFMITFSQVPMEACVDLATQDWNATSGSGMVAVSVGTTAAEKYLGASCTPGTGLACGGKGPMLVSDAVAACTDLHNNTLYLKFY